MRQLRIVAAATFLLAASVVRSAGAPEDRSWLLPASELRPGDKGYGLTVFSGEQPERFLAEIIGVRKNAIGAGVDMIMAKLDHPLLKDIGVVAGMSGSPVFVRGKIIGAIAYGYVYSKEPIAGITPIEEMLKVFDRTTTSPPPRDIALGPAEVVRPGEPVSLEPKLRAFGARAIRFKRSDLAASARAYFDSEDICFEPLAMPLAVSTCSPQTAELIRKMFRPLGMEPLFGAMASGGALLDVPSTVPVASGIAVGIPYIAGDLSAGIIGTLTYTDGRKLVAFGHPALARGPVRLPLAVARINTILRSRYRPFKLGELVALRGSIHQDRLPAIGGVLGKPPAMVPMTVRVVDENDGSTHTYHFQIIDHRLFTPRWASVGLSEAIASAYHPEGDMTVRLTYKIETDDGKIIEKHDAAAGSFAPSALAINLLDDLGPIYSNDFEVRSARRVEAEVHVRDGIEAARLRSAYSDRSIVKPGQTIRVSAYVKPWRKPLRRIRTDLRIPADLADGRYNVVVCDAYQRRRAELVRAPGLYRPRDWNSVVRILRMEFPTDRLYVILTSAERGVTIDGHEFASLPPSIAFTLNRLNDREKIERTIGRVLAETTVRLPFLVEGSSIISIQVDRHAGR